MQISEVFHFFYHIVVLSLILAMLLFLSLTQARKQVSAKKNATLIGHERAVYYARDDAVNLYVDRNYSRIDCSHSSLWQGATQRRTVEKSLL